ncbi:MAG: sugar phosphate isomerase [Paenibacillus sp. RIFOXYA1_FULL_44_5]|nr:MAG: sugar phosphate isomerase [Paenibacillus sp. RIFOXYA1_FULL_44_5]
MSIGLQLYTLRSEMAADLEGTLRKVASLGYEGVEFAGYFDFPADKLRSLLDELGLTAIGSHVGLVNLRGNLAGEIEYVKAIGGSYIICPHVADNERKDADNWKKLYVELQEIGEQVTKQGLQFGYHNHAFEFDIQVDGEFALDALYQATNSEQVLAEMDVCWVQYAGQDPVSYINKYAGRLPLLHLKDFAKDEQNHMQTLELGQGIVQLDEVIAAAAQAGVKWLIVEQDRCQNPPLESIANSMKWLKDHNVL